MFDSSKYKFNLTTFQEKKVKNIFIEFLKKMNVDSSLYGTGQTDPLCHP